MCDWRGQIFFWKKNDFEDILVVSLLDRSELGPAGKDMYLLCLHQSLGESCKSSHLLYHIMQGFLEEGLREGRKGNASRAWELMLERRDIKGAHLAQSTFCEEWHSGRLETAVTRKVAFFQPPLPMNVKQIERLFFQPPGRCKNLVGKGLGGKEPAWSSETIRFVVINVSTKHFHER